MTITEFIALAEGNDFSKVMITCYKGAHAIVSARLCCDDEQDLDSDYSYLKTDDGQLVEFDSAAEATTLIHVLGYKSGIDIIHAGDMAR